MSLVNFLGRSRSTAYLAAAAAIVTGTTILPTSQTSSTGEPLVKVLPPSQNSPHTSSIDEPLGDVLTPSRISSHTSSTGEPLGGEDSSGDKPARGTYGTIYLRAPQNTFGFRRARHDLQAPQNLQACQDATASPRARLSRNAEGISRFFSGAVGDVDFPSHRGVYFITNERGANDTIGILKAQQRIGNTVIGVSGLFNLELFLARAPLGAKYLINMDPDPAYRPFWQYVKDAFAKSKNKEEFIQNLIPVLQENYTTLLPLDRQQPMTKDHFLKSVASLKSHFFPYLFKESGSFETLKALFDEGRFYHFPIDLDKTDKVKCLRDILDKNELKPDTVYFSNVHEYIDFSAWIANTKLLTQGKEEPILVFAGHEDSKYEGHPYQITKRGIEKLS